MVSDIEWALILQQPAQAQLAISRRSTDNY